MTGSWPLPRSLAPLPDESISGYLLRLGHRLDLPPTRLVVVTGLRTTTKRQNHSSAPIGLLTGTDGAVLRRFAQATSLTDTETAQLFLRGYAGRYPPAAPKPDGKGPRGLKTQLDLWLLTTSTRYCPDCLVGDGSEVQRRHGGAWRRVWRLPVVFACTTHRRYLLHRCPACGQPAHQSEHGNLPRWWDHTLHPTRCRAMLGPSPYQRRTEHSACTASLASAPSNGRPRAAVLAVQQRIHDALDLAGPDMVEVLGRHTTASRYFTDLIALSHLIRRSWPLARDLVPGSGLAEALDRHLVDQHQQIAARCRHSGAQQPMLMQNEHRAPPADPVACAALLTTADRLLTLDSPRALTEHLRHLLTHDARRPGRADWTRRFLHERPDSSEALRQAVAPILQTYARTRKPRSLHAPIRRTPFGPEHIAQFLQNDWHQRHLARFDGINYVHLRRTAALHLCQMAAGGSVRQAAVHLGLPDTRTSHYRCYSSVGAVHSWARQRGNPHEFETAVHDLADELETYTQRINYHRRRQALQDWCIDADTWRNLVAQLPEPQQGPGWRQPELGDRKRQSASIIVWTRITGGEHVFAPHPIRDQLSARERDAWRLSAYSMFARFRDGCTRPHDIDLDRLLIAYGTWLAGLIDATGTAQHEPWTG